MSVPSKSELFTAVLWPIYFRENRSARARVLGARAFFGRRPGRETGFLKSYGHAIL